MPSLSRNGNGFWLDPSSGGMVWRPAPTSSVSPGNTMDMQKDQIAEYAPVCIAPTLSLEHQQQQQQRNQGGRFIGDYSNIPADYAEVSTFGKTPSEYSTNGNHSPAPYATSSIVGTSRFNDFNTGPYQSHHQNPSNIYQTANDFYPITTRSAYSESYFHPKETIHITENKLNNMVNCFKFNPSISVPHSPIGTIRRSRFKFSRPQNFHISFGDGYTDGGNNETLSHQSPQPQRSTSVTTTTISDYCSSTETQPMNQQDEKLYIKVGETNPPDNSYMNWRDIPNRPLHNRNVNSNGSNNDSNSNISPIGSGCNSNRRRQDTDTDVIYIPTGNRSLISYRSSNSQVDDV